MSNILALETSTERLSLALSAGPQLFESDFVAEQRHAELILGEIDRLLGQARLSVKDLQAIVYGEGPGAFTGLRIACGVAQGLALSQDLPVLGIGNLMATAEECGAARVIVCLDARMGEVYHGAFEKIAQQWRIVHAAGLYKPVAVPLPEGEGWVGCGSGFAAHGDALRERLGSIMKEVRPNFYPTARAMLRLAAPRLRAGEGVDAALAAPVYIRDKVALKTNER